MRKRTETADEVELRGVPTRIADDAPLLPVHNADPRFEETELCKIGVRIDSLGRDEHSICAVLGRNGSEAISYDGRA